MTITSHRMKKLLALTLSLALLAGCSGGFTAGGESYLDEKIKCKKLAEERFEKLAEEPGFIKGFTNFSPELNTCLISYKENMISESHLFIEDVLSNKVINEAIEKNDLKTESDLQAQNEYLTAFEKDMKRYFGEDAK